MRIVIYEACLNPFAEELGPVMVQLTSLPLRVVEGVMHTESWAMIVKALEGTDDFTRVCHQIHNEAQQANVDRRRCSKFNTKCGQNVVVTVDKTAKNEWYCEGKYLIQNVPFF